jgi:hypothetical protein
MIQSAKLETRPIEHHCRNKNVEQKQQHTRREGGTEDGHGRNSMNESKNESKKTKTRRPKRRKRKRKKRKKVERMSGNAAYHAPVTTLRPVVAQYDPAVHASGNMVASGQ